MKICTLTLLLLCSASLWGQTYANPRFTVFGGGSFLAADRVFFSNGDAFQTKFQRGGRVGARATIDLTNTLAAEASYTFSQNDLLVSALDPPRRERLFETRLHQISGNLHYYFADPSKQVRPFVTGGIGWNRFNPTQAAKILAIRTGFLERPAEIGPANQFGANFGAGFETRLNNWIGLRVEIRDHIMGMPRFGLPKDPVPGQRAAFPVNGLIHNLEPTVGAVFYLR